MMHVGGGIGLAQRKLSGSKSGGHFSWLKLRPYRLVGHFPWIFFFIYYFHSTWPFYIIALQRSWDLKYLSENKGRRAWNQKSKMTVATSVWLKPWHLYGWHNRRGGAWNTWPGLPSSYFDFSKIDASTVTIVALKDVLFASSLRQRPCTCSLQ